MVITNTFDHFKNLAVQLSADFQEFRDSAFLTFDNEFGKGQISTYTICNGLSVIAYDVVFKNEIHIPKPKCEYADSTVCFLYCLEGHFSYKFYNQENRIKIEKKQSVILSSASNVSSQVIVPANVHLKLTAIFLNENIDVNGEKCKTLLESVISDISAIGVKNRPISYFGEPSPLMAQNASILLNNNRRDVVGKLIVEGAVMNILATQIDSHDKSQECSKIGAPLSKSELLKMNEIAEFIADNISDSLKISDISKNFGMSPKKLQAGSRYIFGETLGNFITYRKLDHSLKLIQTTDLNISEICYRIGFSSRSYFSKSFNERFGILPRKCKEAIIN